MVIVPNGVALTGYRVSCACRDAFTVAGNTRVFGQGEANLVPAFWQELASGGHVRRLMCSIDVATPLLGVGSWDPACPEGGSRYTIGIELCDDVDRDRLDACPELYTMTIGASDWLVFDMTWQTFQDRFWNDNPYVMLRTLGYRFHTREGDYTVGLHFERYPPAFSARPDDEISFWITVSSAGSDISHMA